MRVHELVPAKGARHRRKRVGRGIAAGQGKTAGRGTKGQGARSGRGPRRGFEGGQNPLTQRLPHIGGFTNIFRVEYRPVNLARLEPFAAGSRVDPQVLVEAGVIKSLRERVKILAQGQLDKVLHIRAHAFSAPAKAKIEAAGGTWEILESGEGNQGRQV